MKQYGTELILDLHDCSVSTFNRESIEKYLIKLCVLIDMNREDLYWWDYQNEPEEYEKAPAHLKGTSCVQFISTSTITIHTKDVLKTLNVDIFTCKEFEPYIVKEFTEKWFKGRTVNNKGDGYLIRRY